MTGQRDLPTPLFDYETNRAVHEALPEIVVDGLALITRFGDGAVVVTFAMIFFWFGAESDWKRRGMLMAIAVATLALNAGLKGILDVSRPLFAAQAAGDPLVFAPDTYDGLSTPSAHAMGAAAIYGGLAVLMDVGKKWQRYLVAGVLIVTVALSRVVLGLHYPGDVVLGVILGLALVYTALWLERQDDRSVLPLFGFAIVVALVSNPLGSEEFVTMSIGVSIGGFVAWSLVKDREPNPLGASILVFGVILIPALLAFRVVEALVTVDILVEIAGFELPVMAGFRAAGYALLFSLAIAVPVIAQYFDDWSVTQRLQDVLPFDGRTVDTDQIVEDLAD